MVVERRGSSPLAVGALVVANFLPLVGVLWWGWSVFEVLVLYWVESGVVGAYNVPKILLAAGDDFGVEVGADDFGVAPGADGRAGETGEATDGDGRRPSVAWPVGNLPSWLAEAGGRADNLGVAAFFVLHYGVFWVVHGVFVFVLPLFAWGFGVGAGATVTPGGPFAPVGAFGWGFRTSGLAFALAVTSTVLSHGVSFATNFVGREEYRRVTPESQMFSPYGRVFALHLTIVFGAFLVASFGSPLPALVLLVALKTVIDLGAHLREHGAFGVDFGGA